MVDFICMGLLELRVARTENYKMKYSWRQWDSNLVPFTYEANSLSITQIDQISIAHLEIDRILPDFAI